MPPQRRQVSIPWSASSTHPRIYPFFLPFRGCVTRCLFCAQDIVTGQNTSHAPLKPLLDQLWLGLEMAVKMNGPLELAFYGGTFTALSDLEFASCLDLVVAAYAKGLILAARCSTRPDTLNGSRLSLMRKAHFTTIELGIQSFNQESLDICKRAYDRKLALSACQMVKESGFKLGLQLMPGMPKNTPQIFLADVARTLKNGADFLRFYPCLVLANTGLAKLWAGQNYQPWDLDTTINTLAQGLNLAHQKDVPVIRIGLPPQMDLTQVLAGPWCPDLGSRVQAWALFLAVSKILGSPQAKTKNLSSRTLFLPKFMQGFFWGHKAELLKPYAELGLTESMVTFGADSSPTLFFEG